jgi:CBS domain-containing protein
MSAWLAEDIMNPDVLTVRDDMLVRDLALFLTEHEISGAPVVDPNGKPSAWFRDGCRQRRSCRPKGRPAPYYLRAFENRFAVESIRGLRVEHRSAHRRRHHDAGRDLGRRDMPVARIARLC